MNENLYDIVVIGGGPIGLACGIEAKNAGLKYLILEKGTLVNSLYNYPVNMTFFSTSERLEIGGVPFVSNSVKPTRNEALEYYRRIASSFHLNIYLFEEVKKVKNSGKEFEIETSKSVYQSRNIIISTGFYDIPYLLNVKGEELKKVKHYYDDPHFYAFQKVVVVGAANSAVDAALETWRKGAEVTMVIRGDKISDRVKYWVKPDIENRIAENSIKAYFNSTIAEIREHDVDINTPDGLVTIENDWLISMTGYQPNLDFLRSMGVNLSADDVCKPDYNEESYESNVTGIYLAGVICGGMNTHRLFIENSREHAVKIVQDILNKRVINGQ
ncbi:MAG: YpdA family putative bacillithiol disulfide reductase [Bacteroidota bacterium]|nr:YpdA family putative bacillithiol disulfide reductase [Bacteroidota bacterium]